MPLKFKRMMQSSVTAYVFDFMLRMFNNLNQLYVKEKSLLIDTILKYQSMNESAKEVEKPNRYNNTRNGNKEENSKLSPKNVVL